MRATRGAGIAWAARFLAALFLLCLSCADLAAEDVTVYVTKTGGKYHRDSCSSLATSRIPMSLSEALGKGYTPCSKCDPPTTARPGAATKGTSPGEGATAGSGSAASGAKGQESGTALRSILGKVVGVADGDTITVLEGRTEYKIRLNGIDCPEKNQAFGQRAKQYTSDKVYGRTVEVRVVDQDRYGRWVGDVYVDGEWLNASLVRDGFAWHYVAYSKDARLAAFEAEARRKRLGLWADAKPTPPWEFRR